MMRFAMAIFAICLVLPFQDAAGDEVYAIDQSPLFLYKTINWWYDCLPEESDRLCGRPIQCTSTGRARVDFDEDGRTVHIQIKGGLGSLLAVFKSCRNCDGPSHFRCTWLDSGIFGSAVANVAVNGASTISGFTFSKVNRKQAQHIQALAHEWQFTLKGVIGGLANGRIALHASGDLIKKCPAASRQHHETYPIHLSITNTRTHDVIAKFDMVWKQ